MTQIIVRNTTTSDLAVDTLGFTVPASGIFDVSFIDRQHRSGSEEFMTAVENGTLLVVRPGEEPECYWTVEEAKLLLNTGVNKTMVGLEKVKNVLHNYEALNPPTNDTDETLGYSVGSIWIMASGAFRAWVCAYAGEGLAVWGELTQPPISPGVVENRYYGPNITAPLVSDQQYEDLLVAVPMVFPTGVKWNRIGFEVSTAATGGVARLGIYSNVNARPGALLMDAGFVTLETTGKKEIVIDFENPADWFWLVIVTSQFCEILSTVGDNVSALFGLADPSYVPNDTGGVIGAMPYGTLPSTFPTITDDAQRPPYIWLRRV